MSNQFFGLDVSTEKSESEVDKRGIRRAYDQVSEDSYYINAAPDRIDSLPVRAFGIGPPLEEGEIDSTLNDDARREKFLGDLRARGTLEGAFKKQRTTDGVSPPPAVLEPAAPVTTQPPTKLTRLQKELLPRNKPGKKEAPLANERAFRRAKRTRKEKLIKLAEQTLRKVSLKEPKITDEQAVIDDSESDIEDADKFDLDIPTLEQLVQQKEQQNAQILVKQSVNNGNNPDYTTFSHNPSVINFAAVAESTRVGTTPEDLGSADADGGGGRHTSALYGAPTGGGSGQRRDFPSSSPARADLNVPTEGSDIRADLSSPKEEQRDTRQEARTLATGASILLRQDQSSSQASSSRSPVQSTPSLSFQTGFQPGQEAHVETDVLVHQPESVPAVQRILQNLDQPQSTTGEASGSGEPGDDIDPFVSCDNSDGAEITVDNQTIQPIASGVDQLLPVQPGEEIINRFQTSFHLFNPVNDFKRAGLQKPDLTSWRNPGSPALQEESDSESATAGSPAREAFDSSITGGPARSVVQSADSSPTASARRRVVGPIPGSGSDDLVKVPFHSVEYLAGGGARKPGEILGTLLRKSHFSQEEPSVHRVLLHQSQPLPTEQAGALELQPSNIVSEPLPRDQQQQALEDPRSPSDRQVSQERSQVPQSSDGPLGAATGEKFLPVKTDGGNPDAQGQQRLQPVSSEGEGQAPADSRTQTTTGLGATDSFQRGFLLRSVRSLTDTQSTPNAVMSAAGDIKPKQAAYQDFRNEPKFKYFFDYIVDSCADPKYYDKEKKDIGMEVQGPLSNIMAIMTPAEKIHLITPDQNWEDIKAKLLWPGATPNHDREG